MSETLGYSLGLLRFFAFVFNEAKCFLFKVISCLSLCKVLDRVCFHGAHICWALRFCFEDEPAVGSSSAAIVFGALSEEGEEAVRSFALRRKPVHGKLARFFLLLCSDSGAFDHDTSPTGRTVFACDSDLTSLSERFASYPNVKCLRHRWEDKSDTDMCKQEVMSSFTTLCAVVIVVPSAKHQNVTAENEVPVDVDNSSQLEIPSALRSGGRFPNAASFVYAPCSVMGAIRIAVTFLPMLSACERIMRSETCRFFPGTNAYPDLGRPRLVLITTGPISSMESQCQEEELLCFFWGRLQRGARSKYISMVHIHSDQRCRRDGFRFKESRPSHTPRGVLYFRRILKHKDAFDAVKTTPSADRGISKTSDDVSLCFGD